MPGGRRGDCLEAPVAGDGGRTTLEVALDCLRHPRRRFVLYYLRDERTTTVTELARHVAARESGDPPTAVEEERCEHVRATLVHNHRPKLADDVFIEYDPRTETVTYTDPPALLDELLRLVARFEGDPDE